jgi:hypothetical protein
MAEDEVEAYVQTLTKLCPEAAADAPDEIRYIASMLADKVRVQSARELQCKSACLRCMQHVNEFHANTHT